MTTIMFEALNTPAFYVSLNASLALHASGRTTGTVVDIGDGVTLVKPISDGSLPKSIVSRLDLAGRDLTDYLTNGLARSKQFSKFSSGASRDIATIIKETKCYTALDFDAELQTAAEAQSGQGYVLPDGQIVPLGNERFLTPEVLFQPSILALELEGLQEATFKATIKCDTDQRKDLFADITLVSQHVCFQSKICALHLLCLRQTGDGTLFPGLRDRLNKEVSALAPSEMMVNVITPLDRKYGIWVGGSIFASVKLWKRVDHGRGI